MAMSLRPAVRGANSRSVRRVEWLHSSGLAAGAITMGLILSLVRAASLAVGMRAVLLVPAAIALAFAAMQIAGMSVPQRRWQVPEYWRRTLDAGVLPVAYGAILGFGIFTAVVVGAFWVFVAATLLYPAPIALLAWLAYALGRALGFCLTLREPQLERILLSSKQHKLLIVATTLLGALVVLS